MTAGEKSFVIYVTSVFTSAEPDLAQSECSKSGFMSDIRTTDVTCGVMSPLHVVQPWEKLRTVNQDGVFSPHKIWSQIHETTCALDSAKHAKIDALY